MKLPNEILLEIVDNLHETEDLRSVVDCGGRLGRLAVERYMEKACFRVESDMVSARTFVKIRTTSGIQALPVWHKLCMQPVHALIIEFEESRDSVVQETEIVTSFMRAMHPSKAFFEELEIVYLCKSPNLPAVSDLFDAICETGCRKISVDFKAAGVPKTHDRPDDTVCKSPSSFLFRFCLELSVEYR